MNYLVSRSLQSAYQRRKVSWGDYKYTDLSLRVFPQVWGSTALGFGGIGGQAMTAAYTTVVEDAYEGFYSVFFGERLAYLIQNPSDVFFEDMYKCNMKPVSQAGVYKRGEKS